MRYYSDKLNKVFDTPEELEKAEKEAAEKEAALKIKKAEKEKRYQEVQDAYKKYVELVIKYLEDYNENENINSVWSLLSWLDSLTK